MTSLQGLQLSAAIDDNFRAALPGHHRTSAAGTQLVQLSAPKNNALRICTKIGNASRWESLGVRNEQPCALTLHAASFEIWTALGAAFVMS